MAAAVSDGVAVSEVVPSEAVPSGDGLTGVAVSEDCGADVSEEGVGVGLVDSVAHGSGVGLSVGLGVGVGVSVGEEVGVGHVVSVGVGDGVTELVGVVELVGLVLVTLAVGVVLDCVGVGLGAMDEVGLGVVLAGGGDHGPTVGCGLGVSSGWVWVTSSAVSCSGVCCVRSTLPVSSVAGGTTPVRSGIRTAACAYSRIQRSTTAT